MTASNKEIAKQLLRLARSLVAKSLPSGLASDLKQFGRMDGGRLYSDMLDKAAYNRTRKQLSQKLKSLGYKPTTGPTGGKYFANDDGETIVIYGDRMPGGWVFSIEAG